MASKPAWICWRTESLPKPIANSPCVLRSPRCSCFTCYYAGRSLLQRCFPLIYLCLQYFIIASNTRKKGANNAAFIFVTKIHVRKGSVEQDVIAEDAYQFYSMSQGEGPSAIKYRLTPSETSTLDRLLDTSEMSTYFQSLSANSSISNQMLSSHYATTILFGITSQLHDGKLGVSKNSKTVESLIDEVVLKEEEQRALQMKAKKMFIEKQLEVLKLQTSLHKVGEDEDKEAMAVLSREEHKALVQRIKRQREDQEKKHQQALAKLQAKSKEKEEQAERQRRERQEAELQARREQIQRSLLRHRQEHQQHLQAERASREKMKALSSHKFTYQQIQQKYQQEVVMKQLEEKKQKLKEIRQYRSFNLDDLNQHERAYLNRKKLSESRQASQQQDWTYKPPQRSQRLTSILEEERLQRIRTLQEKKKQLDDKLNRHQQYVAYLKDNFTPTIDPKKREQLNKRLEKEKRERPQAPDLKEIGLAYLEEARRRRKKIDKQHQPRPQTERNPTNSVNATNMSIGSERESKARAATNYLTIDHNEHSQKRRRKHIEKLVHSDQLDQVQKIKQLKVEAEKIGEDMQRKQRELKYSKDGKLKEDTLQLLLSSIQAKIGIIRMYH